MYSARCLPLMLLLLGESGKSYRKGTIPIHTSPRGSGGPSCPQENRGNPEALKSFGKRAKTLLLGESCRLVPPTSFPSGKAAKATEKAQYQCTRPPGALGALASPRRNPGNPKVPEYLMPRAKTLLLGESCRLVPPTPGTPQADRQGHLTGPRPVARDLHFRTTPSRLVQVDGSRKLPQIIIFIHGLNISSW